MRAQLSQKFGVPFRPLALKLSTGGMHEFDAVSEDRRIVASIKTAGGRTASGRFPVGKIKSTEAELYYLALVPAEVRLLVLTSREFYAMMKRRLEGRLAPGISLELVLLPSEMEEEVRRIRRVASREVAPTRTRTGGK